MCGMAKSWMIATSSVPKIVRLARPILSERPPMNALNAPIAFDTTRRYRKNANDMW